MTNAEKATKYDRLVELLQDRIALELHYRKENAGFSTIETVRAEAYLSVVQLIVGFDTIPASISL